MGLQGITNEIPPLGGVFLWPYPAPHVNIQVHLHPHNALNKSACRFKWDYMGLLHVFHRSFYPQNEIQQNVNFATLLKLIHKFTASGMRWASGVHRLQLHKSQIAHSHASVLMSCYCFRCGSFVTTFHRMQQGSKRNRLPTN